MEKGYEVGPQHHSKLLFEQAPHKIRESLERDGAEMDTPVRVISHDIGTSDLKELEGYFTALEQDRRNLQQLLQDQEEEHMMELRALERERVQERAEWERQRAEREEALLSAMISMAINRQKLMEELRSQPSTLVSTKHLGGTAQSKPRKGWWCFKKQAIADVAPQDAPSSSACKAVKADQLDLTKLKELERKVREAEKKKQLKALAKAEKKARRVERCSRKKKDKKTQKQDNTVNTIKLKRRWHCCICVTSSVEN